MAESPLGFGAVRGAGPNIPRIIPLTAGSEPRTPVTVVTGPGQAGKAMLLGRLGRDPALARTVIVTVDHGGFAADQPLADDAGLPSGGISDGAEMGCICCAAQGDLQRSLRALLPKARRGEVLHVIVDASVRSDSMSILATVITDPVLAAVYRTGGVVAVVDESGGFATPQGRRQLIVADRIVVTSGAVALNAVRSLNPVAHIADCMAPPRFILEENRFAPHRFAPLPRAQRRRHRFWRSRCPIPWTGLPSAAG